MFVGLQVLALPAEALASCQMACSVNGGFCCCKAFGGTGHHRSVDGTALTQPHTASFGKICPAFASPSVDSRELVDTGKSSPLLAPETVRGARIPRAPVAVAPEPFLPGALPRPPPPSRRASSLI